ncbi:MAG: BACON domain-containing carbohydrate-binding protein [Bryobacteraceae bacterium]
MLLRCAASMFVMAAAAAAQVCIITLNPATLNVPAEENVPPPVQVTASASTCARTAQSNASWITISFGQSGTGNGSVGLRIDANRDPAPRTGSVTIGGVSLSVTQAAARCSFDLSPAEASIAPAGGSGAVSFQTTCNWTVITDASWITITSATSGTGNGRVSFNAAANNTGSARSGIIRIGSAQFRVTQTAPSCTIAVAPTQASAPAAGGPGSFAVTATCSWTAASTASWIQIVSGATGSGNGTVSYAVSPNPTTQSRTGTINVGSQAFTVTQAAASCAVTLNPSEARLPAEGGSASIRVSAACPWTATTSDTWITIASGASGSADGSFSFSVSRNTGAARSGAIIVGTQTLAVQQAGAGCSVTFSPAAATASPAGGTGTVLIASSSECRWTAAVSSQWLTLDVSDGQGNGVIRWIAMPNTTGFARSATISATGVAFTVTQAAAIPTFTAAGVVSAASFVGGAISPGGIITIFGTDLGGADLVTAEVTADGAFLTKALAGTQVLFDDVPAALLYVIKDQLACVVPFGVAGKPSVRIQVAHGESRSAAVPVLVAPASPGLFTANASGSGPGAIRNSDLSINAPANPIARGDIVVLYGAGAGVFDPALADGEITGKVLAVPGLPVTVEIGGVEAAVQYAGVAPFLVAGVLQVNVAVPQNIAPGPAVPVKIRVGTFASQDGVTLAVR